MRGAGIEVRFDRSQAGYAVGRPHFLPPTSLTAAEALAAIALLSANGSQQELPLAAEARSAALKIEASLPPGLRDVVGTAVAGVDVRPAPGSIAAGADDAFDRLLEAQRTQTTVSLRYDSLYDGRVIDTLLDPYKLVFVGHAWYAIGSSSFHDSIRTFHVGRVRSLAPVDAKFEVPRGFSLRGYLGNAWRMMPEPGPDVDAHVHFTPMVARNVAEVAWHPTQRCEFRPDGSLDFYVRLSGIVEFSWWVLGYADQAEVIGPERLRTLVAQRVRAASQRYDTPIGPRIASA